MNCTDVPTLVYVGNIVVSDVLLMSNLICLYTHPDVLS